MIFLLKCAAPVNEMEKKSKFYKNNPKNKLCGKQTEKKIVLAHRIYSEFLVDIF